MVRIPLLSCNLSTAQRKQPYYYVLESVINSLRKEQFYTADMLLLLKALPKQLVFTIITLLEYLPNKFMVCALSVV